jgi:large subunit ribosomal protein L6
MSRIGRKPIQVPADVKVSVSGATVLVESKKGKLSLDVHKGVGVEVKGSEVHVSADDGDRSLKALHGLTRSLINNMVVGVTQGYKKELTIVGVGFKAAIAGQKLTLNLGYSHPIVYMIPAGVKVTVVEGTKVVVEGLDKQLVGEVSARIRRFKKPEPYKGKGVRYSDEQVTIKPGKTNA